VEIAMRSAWIRALVAAGFALALRLQPALACSVCFDQNAERRAAFLSTTAFLSLLPLALIAGLVYTLHRRWIAAEVGESPDSNSRLD
jgi:hypothetical protein